MTQLAKANEKSSADLAEFSAPAVSRASQQIGDLLMNTALLEQVEIMADKMVKSKISVPEHLRNSPGDCYAVAMQAVQWGMNPFAVASKTHVSKSGQLGYEAQLINAVVTTLGPTQDRPEYVFLGDWSKILGRVIEKTSEKGGKYYVAGWKPEDEAGLGVICSVTIRGESKPREITVMLSQCYPRFSTQWATDPQQQITYVAVRKLARRYFPDVILGVYTADELEDIRPERDITPTVAPEPEQPTYSEDAFSQNLPKWQALIEQGKKTAEDIIKSVSSKARLTEKQKQSIRSIVIPVVEGEVIPQGEQQ